MGTVAVRLCGGVLPPGKVKANQPQATYCDVRRIVFGNVNRGRVCPGLGESLFKKVGSHRARGTGASAALVVHSTWPTPALAPYWGVRRALGTPRCPRTGRVTGDQCQ